MVSSGFFSVTRKRTDVKQDCNKTEHAHQTMGLTFKGCVEFLCDNAQWEGVADWLTG